MADFINLAEISKRIRELQDMSGMTAKDFSAKTEIPASTLSQINNGKILPSVDNINKIIDKWSDLMSPTYLLFGIRDEGLSNRASLASSEGAQSSDLFSSHGQDDRLREVLIGQAEEIGRLKEQIEASRPKEISHITVFYTDSSFATFSLESSKP
ncbi:helix-turn-helix domain-containing protein [Porphyromonas sp. COT-239 OH1446]|uniref:helix-turn-helix domain-containing protein n=1 Tax=Porphyromonas sp. COT-239 OH1446 TaxID=1515613 RepID=UPI00052D12DB|nr:helix-turn-helix transcriptional regulator [Porphyromonas sp. COT-239 OH1446]KGN67175.1 hypothetical protein HQ37_08095 [Porphyromonas sp. COT-239 OH1446]